MQTIGKRDQRTPGRTVTDPETMIWKRRMNEWSVEEEIEERQSKYVKGRKTVYFA